MDNGALVFIIVFEAIAIVWLLSKLKQYQKVENLLSSSVAATDVSPAASVSTPATVAEPVASPNKPLEPEYDELLDMPGIEPELNVEEAKRVQSVMARCRYAEFYLEQLDDDYERGQFKRIVNSCMATTQGITDPFFKANALHPLIVLLDKAGWEDKRDQLIGEVHDEHVLEQIRREVAATETA